MQFRVRDLLLAVAVVVCAGPLTSAAQVDTGATPPAAAAPAAPARVDTMAAVSLAKRLQDQEERNRTFKFGVSVGWRRSVGHPNESYRDAALKPGTDTVYAEKIDRGDVVLSGVVVVFPWKRPSDAEACCAEGRRLWRLGFIANIDLASFGDDGLQTFNKSVEGGLGGSLRLADDFAVAMTIERVLSRRLRSFVVPGQPLPRAVNDSSAFDRQNDQYYVNDNLTALSIKFVYFLR